MPLFSLYLIKIKTLDSTSFFFPCWQIGLKGEALSLHTLGGSSSVDWVQGSLLAYKQPLAWYKVRIKTMLLYDMNN